MNIIKTLYRSLPMVSRSERVKRTARSETHNQHKPAEPVVVVRDRRKNKTDRRNPDSQLRPLYELRSKSRGRRKTDGNPNIEVDV